MISRPTHKTTYTVPLYFGHTLKQRDKSMYKTIFDVLENMRTKAISKDTQVTRSKYYPDHEICFIDVGLVGNAYNMMLTIQSIDAKIRTPENPVNPERPIYRDRGYLSHITIIIMTIICNPISQQHVNIYCYFGR